MTSPTSSPSAATTTANTTATPPQDATPRSADSSTATTRPGLILLFSWYRERPDWIAAALTSASRLGITHVIALDGAYFLLPDARPRSSTYEHLQIIETCNALDIGLTLAWPALAWTGNEVEKRTALFRHADAICEPGDWLLVWDADEIATNPHDIRSRLAQTPEDAAELTFTQEERDEDRTISRAPIRKLFRWTPGIHADTNHFTYRTRDNRTLWGQRDQAPAADFTDLVLEHRTNFRPPARHRQQRTYYERRQQTLAEAHDCELCAKPRSSRHYVPINLTPAGTRNGQQAFEGLYGMVCDNCKPLAEANVRVTLRKHGCDPDGFRHHAVIA